MFTIKKDFQMLKFFRELVTTNPTKTVPINICIIYRIIDVIDICLLYLFPGIHWAFAQRMRGNLQMNLTRKWATIGLCAVNLGYLKTLYDKETKYEAFNLLIWYKNTVLERWKSFLFSQPVSFRGSKDQCFLICPLWYDDCSFGSWVPIGPLKVKK